MRQLLCVFASLFASVLSQDRTGEGLWSLVDIADCEEEINEEYIVFDMDKHKINRTHDGFSATIKLNIQIDESIGVLIEVCKFVDGGCKHTLTLADDSVVNFAKKYAEDNVKRALELVGLDPPDFPLPKGNYNLENFVMDYCEVPTSWFYGKYEAEAFLLKGDEKIGGLKLVLEFNKAEDDDDLC